VALEQQAKDLPPTRTRDVLRQRARALAWVLDLRGAPDRLILSDKT
jgi:hypothetical protein